MSPGLDGRGRWFAPEPVLRKPAGLYMARRALHVRRRGYDVSASVAIEISSQVLDRKHATRR